MRLSAEERPLRRVEPPLSALERHLHSVVKIFTNSCSHNYQCPWNNNLQKEIMGSGFVIPGRKILTNARVIANHKFVLVRKHGSVIKNKAEVQAVGHDCDLALLTVNSEEFWVGMNFLDFGDIPFFLETITVVGYPQGGNNISVTEGVVSKVEPIQYVHNAEQSLAIKTNAVIDSGNNGGLAIVGDKIVGVVFQNLSDVKKIGYIIPVPIIKYFLSRVEENGEYDGFCSLGLSYQSTEIGELREYFGMHLEMTGVLINKIYPLSAAFDILKKDDIILAFDGIPIANDGTVPFRNVERIKFDHLVSMKKSAEKALLRVLRDGIVHELSVFLRPLQPLVPVRQFDKSPSYYIFGGLVFMPLTQPYLHEYGHDPLNTSPHRLYRRALTEPARKVGEQLVILSQVLTDDVNIGYEEIRDLQVKKVNGIEVDNLKHLCRLVEDCYDEFVRFDFDDERMIIFEYRIAKLATFRILEQYGIRSAMSDDMTDEINCSEAEVEAEAENQPSEMDW